MLQRSKKQTYISDSEDNIINESTMHYNEFDRKYLKLLYIIIYSNILLIILVIVSSVWSGYQIAKMEILKVGWKENFEKIQMIMKSREYKEQYAQQLNLMLQELSEANRSDKPIDVDNLL